MFMVKKSTILRLGKRKAPSSNTEKPFMYDPHFLWSDIQLSKASTTKNKYWLSYYNGVKKCGQCDHVLSKSYLKNNCSQHPTADLIATEGCAVEFLSIFSHKTLKT